MRSPNGSLLPLTSQIASDFSRDQQRMLADEAAILRDLNVTQLALDHFSWEEDVDEWKRIYKQFDKVWEDTQEYYIRTQACGIIVTAATAMTKMLRVFRPQQFIVGEGSQFTEFVTVAVISRFFDNLRKVLIVGDPCQKKPFVLNQNSEFVDTTETSLMVRLSNSGVPITRLREQFRMNPHIAQPVSSLFYEATLINSPSVLSRPKDRIMQTFHGQTLQECAKRHSIFVHVKNYVPYRLEKTQSMLNPSRLAIVHALIDRSRAAGANDRQIAVLTPYKGQSRLLRTWETADLTMATIDSAPGKEYDFVILDLVSPGGFSRRLQHKEVRSTSTVSP
ncbi:hypothetical protein HO173_009428 [Letharia columbiana]|uniref:DNA2/NAM7 helicase-like C-terminal domain-containing protein n=1 Tax=Letharia columbiana TaxID=112416 RepID=A0A8H6L1R0_9LECA|nr:uncharacterized protein HO173_009428 [Letharia columbiana]KAF6232323.1 hypothetical protein HO173_009428 [Letharia columbiana]